MKHLTGILLVVLCAVLAGPGWAASFTGPLSSYYLIGDSTIYVIRGPSVVTSFHTAYGGGASEGVLAIVGNTVRTRASDLRSFPDAGAGEYMLNGLPTGNSWTTPPTGNLRYYDGTSDGSFTWFVDHGQDSPEQGGVWRADASWQNPMLLFSPQGICNNAPPGCHGLSGIAYDSLTKSLWVSARGDTRVQNYSLEGALLGEFDARSFGYNTALAVDSADHTLWMTTGGGNTLRQYSLDTGLLLQEGVPAGLPDASDVYQAAEFAVPETSSLGLVLWGLMALAAARGSTRY